MWNKSEVKIDITLIRHGMTLLNEHHKYVGVTDEPLSKLGIAGINEKKNALCYPSADMLFVSPMLRCVETARLIYGDKSYSEIAEYREMDFGEFEGLCYEELKHDTRYQRFIDSGGEYPFPGGEGKADFVKRCLVGYDKMLEQIYEYAQLHELKSIHAVAVVHGGTIMALRSSLCDMDYYSCQIKNGECVTWSIT